MMKLVALGAILGAAAGQGGTGASAPIYLASEPVSGGMRFQVIGAPAARFQGSFSLEVVSGGNQSRHQGSANLAAGQRSILSTVTVGLPEPKGWKARLRVEPSGAAAYEQVLGSE